MDGVANHLDDLDALRDEDPDRCESNDDVATHLQLGLDRTFPPLSLKVGHQVLQFALRLGFVTNLNGIIGGPLHNVQFVKYIFPRNRTTSNLA